jgi:TolB-like protein/Flp pilus assembly protein TadD
MVMSCYEGETLAAKIKSQRIPMDEALDIACQIASGLAKAHGQGIVHRDIKSGNVMITRDGVAKILDFGLAKLRGQAGVTKAGSTLGTVSYMSPEQAGGKEADQRSDLWSLGVVFYEMLAGRLPFQGEYEQAAIYSILNEAPAKIKSMRPETLPELERIVDRCLEKDPDKRYQRADEIIADLRSAQPLLSRTINVSRQRPKRAMWVGIGVALLSVLILGYFLLPRKKADVGEKSIAVLPFVDMSPHKDQEYFCDGMTEELINRLSKIQALRVPARTSAFYFKGKASDIKEIGSKLNVQTVLEGSVQKAGERLRITAQLINVADGYHLWSEKYDRKLEDVFAIQDEISSAIVDALQLKLTPGEAERLAEHPMDNAKAYDYYLKASRAGSRFDEKSLDSTLANLETARDIMGDNAQLFAGMALVFHQYANIGIRQEDYIEKAREYAQKALTLQPELSSAFIQLGNLAVYEEYPKNIQDGFRYYQRALAVNPREFGAMAALATQFNLSGRSSQAKEYLDRLEREDPLNPRCHIARGYNHLYGCRFEPALKELRLLLHDDPQSPLAQLSCANALALSGQHKEALAVIERMDKESGSDVITGFALLLKYALLGDRESALRLITPDFRRTCRRDPEWSYWLGHYLALLGAREEALYWLENAIRRGFINYPFFQCDPFLDYIRGEERFKKLMEHAKHEWKHFEVPE